MRQTAVEWLFEQTIQLNSDMKYSVINWETYLSKRAELLEQAKEMEKQQVIDAYQTSHISMMTAEQYYNEKFKQKQNGSNTNE